MDMEKKESGIKKFSQSEKLSILDEAERLGVKSTLEKYDLYPATYYYWKKKLAFGGEEALNHAKHRNLEVEIKRLSKENESLKLLLAERELESRLKDELIKKKYPEMRKKI